MCEAYHDKTKWPELFESAVGMVFFGTLFWVAGGMSQSEMLQAALMAYDVQDVEREPLYHLKSLFSPQSAVFVQAK